MCRGHTGSYFTQTPLCLQHTAGTMLLDIPSVCVCVHGTILSHTVTRSRHDVLFLYTFTTGIADRYGIFLDFLIGLLDVQSKTWTACDAGYSIGL